MQDVPTTPRPGSNAARAGRAPSWALPSPAPCDSASSAESPQCARPQRCRPNAMQLAPARPRAIATRLPCRHRVPGAPSLQALKHGSRTRRGGAGAPARPRLIKLAPRASSRPPLPAAAPQNSSGRASTPRSRSRSSRCLSANSLSLSAGTLDASAASTAAASTPGSPTHEKQPNRLSAFGSSSGGAIRYARSSSSVMGCVLRHFRRVSKKPSAQTCSGSSACGARRQGRAGREEEGMGGG